MALPITDLKLGGAGPVLSRRSAAFALYPRAFA